MGDPPDTSSVSGKYKPHITFDNTKTLEFPTQGPKFLIMTRVPTSDNDTTNLYNVSPFLIKKVIDSTCSGEIEICKKLSNGTILLKTKNVIQASKLIKLTSLSQTIKINISEHKSLNTVKGVIYSNGLRGTTEEELLSELKNQNVINVYKIKKKNIINNNDLVETGLIILTFASTSLPESINIGYEKVNIRTYIPLPLRCKNCLNYGHTFKVCKNLTICPDCSGAAHVNKENNETCNKEKLCIHCKNSNTNCNHSTYDKNCPTFLKEKEIQAIITIEKVNRKTAITTYNNRHTNNNSNSTFANTLKSDSHSNNKPTSSHQETNNTPNIPLSNTSLHKIPQNTTIGKRTLTDYDSMEMFNSTNQKSKITILPTRTSNRVKSQLKKIANKKSIQKLKNSQANSKSCSESSDSSAMEINLD